MEKKNGPIRVLQILFMALLYGQLIFAVLVLILVKAGLFKASVDGKTERIFEIVGLVISFVAVSSALWLFKRKMETVNKIIKLEDRFIEYRGACITKYSLLEIPSLLSIVFYLLTGKWNFIMIAVALIFIFMGQNPIRQRIKAEMNIDDAQVDEINKLQG